jgi:hypothetical protein
VQSKSSTITIYAYNTNGAYLTSMTIPVSATGLCRDQKIYDFSKTPKPTSFFDDNSSLYVFNNLT